ARMTGSRYLIEELVGLVAQEGPQVERDAERGVLDMGRQESRLKRRRRVIVEPQALYEAPTKEQERGSQSQPARMAAHGEDGGDDGQEEKGRGGHNQHGPLKSGNGKKPDREEPGHQERNGPRQHIDQHHGPQALRTSHLANSSLGIGYLLVIESRTGEAGTAC